MDRLDKSLDELAKEKREEEKAKREKQAKVVKAAKPTVAKVQEQPRGGGRGGRGDGGGGGRGSILSRVGESSGGRAAPISGTLVLFKNLKREVNDADVQELARTVGEIKKGEVITNHRNESTGVAEVIFSKRSDATKAVQKFNGLTLDGRPMEVVISDGPAGGHSNKAASFGSALHQPSFSVTLQDPILRQRNEGMRDDRRVMLHPNDGHNSRNDRRNDDRRNDDRRNDDRRGNGRGGEGRGEGRNDPRNDRKPRDGPRDKKDKPTPSMADLDSQLDAFRAGK